MERGERAAVIYPELVAYSLLFSFLFLQAFHRCGKLDPLSGGVWDQFPGKVELKTQQDGSFRV